ncbi:hypothetical protein SADUNF_Sadunf03G0088900 [Salix dunnii]|uniref:DNA-directed RNA polymerase n=1 Tax=Salix dunnii TaxID=1413687 RepID=A0A835K7W4_9ROSI|nr:hypothetical protein SADUNF_Sadunf03G0088900 [Salix dunnii]
MVDFRGVANKLSLQVVDCLKTSKPKKSNDYVNNASGLRWIKDVVLGKQNDHSFRMVIVGDPNLQLHEIGMPCHIAERLQDSEFLTAWNWEKLSACFEKGEMHVRRAGNLQLQMFHPVRFLLPAVKAPSANARFWTGKQLISMLLPVGFDHDFPSSYVCFRNGDLVYSEGSFWLRETDGNLFQSLGRQCHGQLREFFVNGWDKRRADDATESAKRYKIVLSVTMLIFLRLNLFRRIMFFMRDLHGALDGTVRHAYGNQLVQFSYNINDKDPSVELMGSITVVGWLADLWVHWLHVPALKLHTVPWINRRVFGSLRPVSNGGGRG